MNLTLTDVLTFIAGQASAEDLNRIWDAARARQKALRAIRAAAVNVGQDVVLAGLRPRELDGLTGTVISISRTRGQVRLDEASTRRLRDAQITQTYVPDGVTEHILGGIPLSCCHPRSGQPSP
ncbi:MAG TPA: hypothetical protein VFQ85_07405 [Mycobacteriales bacterium]|nr:hypothetical protein [Mycobacteriales bacterium]